MTIYIHVNVNGKCNILSAVLANNTTYMTSYMYIHVYKLSAVPANNTSTITSYMYMYTMYMYM